MTEPVGKPLLVADAAAYMGVTVRDLRKLVARRRVALCTITRPMRFLRTDLDTALLQYRKPPVWER